MRFVVAAGLALAAAFGSAAGAGAGEPVKIGAVYPLSGALAGAGARAKAAIEIAADIVNNPHPGLEKLPLGSGKGLPHLNGAKIEIVFADHQGNPSVGQSQVMRLASHDKAAALIGAYQSPATLDRERRGGAASASRSSSPMRRRPTSPAAASSGSFARPRSMRVSPGSTDNSSPS